MPQYELRYTKPGSPAAYARTLTAPDLAAALILAMQTALNLHVQPQGLHALTQGKPLLVRITDATPPQEKPKPEPRPTLAALHAQRYPEAAARQLAEAAAMASAEQMTTRTTTQAAAPQPTPPPGRPTPPPSQRTSPVQRTSPLDPGRTNVPVRPGANPPPPVDDFEYRIEKRHEGDEGLRQQGLFD